MFLINIFKCYFEKCLINEVVSLLITQLCDFFQTPPSHLSIFSLLFHPWLTFFETTFTWLSGKWWWRFRWLCFNRLHIYCIWGRCPGIITIVIVVVGVEGLEPIPNDTGQEVGFILYMSQLQSQDWHVETDIIHTQIHTYSPITPGYICLWITAGGNHSHWKQWGLQGCSSLKLSVL